MFFNVRKRLLKLFFYASANSFLEVVFCMAHWNQGFYLASECFPTFKFIQELLIFSAWKMNSNPETVMFDLCQHHNSDAMFEQQPSSVLNILKPRCTTNFLKRVGDRDISLPNSTAHAFFAPLETCGENSPTVQTEFVVLLQEFLHGIQRNVYCNSDARSCIRLQSLLGSFCAFSP